MAYILTAADIDRLSIGDTILNCFNSPAKIVSIYHKGTDVNGKKFACFYQEFGYNATMSNTAKEGNELLAPPIFMSIMTEAREWLKECDFRDMYDDHSEIDEATDADIIAAIDRHYAGGMRQLIIDCSPASDNA